MQAIRILSLKMSGIRTRMKRIIQITTDNNSDKMKRIIRITTDNNSDNQINNLKNRVNPPNSCHPCFKINYVIQFSNTLIPHVWDGLNG